MDQPFNREIIYPLEKPLADDVNAGFSEGDRSLRHSLFWLLGGQSGFLRGSLQIVPSTPNALSVVMKAGQAFFDAPTDTPANIGGVVGLNDLARYKPIVLSADLTINIPTPPGANSRIDLIEVAYLRQSDNSQSRNFLNTGTNQFAPALVAKTLDFNVDASLGFFAAAATPNTAIAYKSGVVAGSPVPPATDTGYMAVAYITVAAGVVTITAANIQDERTVIALGAYLGRQLFTANGTYTPTPGATRARIRVVGGGGGGGGCANAASSVGVAGGGASGRYLEHTISSNIPLTGGAVTIGAAGAGGAAGNNPGIAGGDTSVVVNGTTYLAKGGGGGPGAAAHDIFFNQGGTIPAGSTATDIQAGQNGGPGAGNAGLGVTSAVFGGTGGSNPLGTGGAGGSSTAGAAGIGYGAGGGGGGDIVATSRAGGNGTAGAVIIDEWM